MLESLDPALVELVGAGGIAGLALAVVKLAEIVARLTPTETDNKILTGIRTAARVIALDVPDNPGKPDGTGAGTAS